MGLECLLAAAAAATGRGGRPSRERRPGQQRTAWAGYVTALPSSSLVAPVPEHHRTSFASADEKRKKDAAEGLHANCAQALLGLGLVLLEDAVSADQTPANGQECPGQDERAILQELEALLSEVSGAKSQAFGQGLLPEPLHSDRGAMQLPGKQALNELRLLEGDGQGQPLPGGRDTSDDQA
jgi:hypothetical protein